MSKKKNTLKDLDEFLKQQAANLVAPEKLSDKLEENIKTEQAEQPKPVSNQAIALPDQVKQMVNEKGIEAFCDLIINTLKPSGSISSEQILLINTALYLKHGSNWKAAVRDFWDRNS